MLTYAISTKLTLDKPLVAIAIEEFGANGVNSWNGAGWGKEEAQDGAKQNEQHLRAAAGTPAKSTVCHRALNVVRLVRFVKVELEPCRRRGE